MPTETNRPAVNKKLEEEVHKQLAKRPMPKMEQKEKTRMSRWTLFMSFLMVFIMVGAGVLAAVSGLGWM
ncbi:DUF4044 domain-containing protein [Eupransor demetentiae]|uniref:DUF4044 domain-containing protein n=1 Tax=Eupransor demetentiae TaxID=3109584 RepID=A0ABP0ESQ9_9LACO|nr:hypothetical protein R54876_GBNLAHCA_00773 [Lactobacillaceae bacterium LMG 33000]